MRMSNSCNARKLNIRDKTVLKVGKSLINNIQPQINHNKTEKKQHHTKSSERGYD